MDVLRTVSRRYLPLLLVVVSAAFLATPFAIVAEQVSSSEAAANFVLSTGQGNLSLKATNAPLKAILEQMGEALDIQVEAQVEDDETVSDEFKGLPVDEALRRLAPNYAILTGKDDEKITKIVIMPKGEAADLAAETQQTPVGDGKSRTRSEPFKFEFDPSAVMPAE